MSNEYSTAMVWLVVVAIAAIACLGYAIYQQDKEIDAEADKYWNDGIHDEDGGNWRIKGTEGRRGQYIIYECDKCGKTFEATSRLK
jgi:hypothetical protein